MFKKLLKLYLVIFKLKFKGTFVKIAKKKNYDNRIMSLHFLNCKNRKLKNG